MSASVSPSADPLEKGVTVPWWVRYSRWRQTSGKEAADAERRLLSLARTNMKTVDVKLSDQKYHYLHTLVGGTEGKPNLVWCPGYGAGTGFFFRNFNGLESHFKLFAVDWLGTGLSGRPRYTPKTREESEDWFVSSLATWREKQGIDKFVLMGHSLGGYLSCCYALKHPEHVEHLVLVCPAGVPRKPESWEQRFMTSPLRTAFFKFVMWGWNKGATPGQLIRMLGPMGPNIVNKYVSGRFDGEGLSEEESKIFQEYFYHIAAAPGSGEHALRHLLAPGAWAYAPIEERLKELKVPVTFIYGAHDWMRPEHAVRVCKQLSQQQPLKDPQDLRVEIIPDSGHYVFMEQPELFNRAVLAACETPLMKAHEPAPSHLGFTTSDPSQALPPGPPAASQTPSIEDLATFT